MKYRSDIDGLRAIAILLVLFFHAGLKLFPSGFIGVDVFFVISGFLITGIIHNALQKNDFSFSEFYKRRLWRLQPVFICLLLTTALLTLLFYLPEDLVQYSKSARKASLFISNNYFGRVTSNYFAPINNQLPLLHTWSLSIEWQCYLILPIVMVFFHRILGPRHFTKIIYLLTLCFLIGSLYLSAHHPEKTYYHLLNRIFEFLIGSCVVLLPITFNGRLGLDPTKAPLPSQVSMLGQGPTYVFKQYWLDIIGFMAISTLFYIAMQNNIQAGFPNGYAIILCIATAVLIVIGQHRPDSLPTRLLSLQPMVFTGLISYSLYIWHWPIFVLMHYLGMQETPTLMGIAFVFVFIVAWLSWRFIEKPTRQFSKIKFSYSLVYLFILPVLVIHLGAQTIKKHEGYPQRFAETARIETKLKKYNSPQRESCLQEKNIAVHADCILGSKNPGAKKALMIGDSYSNHYWRFMEVLAKAADVSVVAHATAACLSLPGVSQYDWNHKVYTACHKQAQRYFQLIEHNHYNYVIIGENWNGYLGNKLILKPNATISATELAKKKIEKALDSALQRIIATGARPVLVRSIEVGNINPHSCFYEHIKRREHYKPGQCDFAFENTEHQWQDVLFIQMQKKYTQLIIIAPEKAQCSEGLCKATINGVPVYRDAGHIYDYGAYQIGKIFLKKYQNPLLA